MKQWTLLPCQQKYVTCTTVNIVLCQFKHRSVIFVKGFLKLFFFKCKSIEYRYMIWGIKGDILKQDQGTVKPI